MYRRKRTTANHAKDPAIVWEALDLLKEDYWSPEQISADMKSRGKNISHELIYRHIRADQSGELASYCRHKMKYNRHVRPNRTTKVKNIPDRVSIHQRPAEADGTRFGDWEMDTIVGKDGKGAILTLTERSTNMILMERLPEGKHPEPLAKVVVRLLFPYRKTIRSITTDNGSEFCAHKLISKESRQRARRIRTSCSLPIHIVHGRKVQLRMQINLYGSTFQKALTFQP